MNPDPAVPGSRAWTKTRRTWFLSLAHRSQRNEEGFSIIEVLAAFGILAIVTVGIVPLFVAGLRSSLISKLDTGARNHAQERFELMRNLPFHVDVNATLITSPPGVSGCADPNRTDPTGCDYRDLLDTYYRSLVAASAVTGTGFVATGTARQSGEPIGPFYRVAFNPIPGFPTYRQYVATQFLNANLQPVDPVAVTPTYNSQQTSDPRADDPVSRLIGVTVITRWTAGALTRQYVAYTQISDTRPRTPIVDVDARATGLAILSNIENFSDGLTPSRQLRLEAGIATGNGTLAAGALAAARAQAGFTDIVGEASTRQAGNEASANAPPNTTSPNVTTIGSRTLDENGDGIAEAFFGDGSALNASASIVNEQPVIGTSAAPVTGQINDATTNGSLTLTYNNMRGSTVSPIPSLDLSKAPVRVIDEGGGATYTAHASVDMSSTPGTSHLSRAQARAATHNIRILPTTFSSGDGAEGIVQAQLSSATLNCRAPGAGSPAVTGTATGSFSAVVKYAAAVVQLDGTWQNEYQTVNLTESSGSLPDPSTILVTTAPGTSALPDKTLADWIQGWGTLTTPSTGSANLTQVDSTWQGVVNITTKDTRTDTSSISIQLGVLSCSTVDTR